MRESGKNTLKSRAYYQFRSLTLKKREKSADVWEFRYYEDAATGGRTRKALFVGTTDKYKTEAQARKAVEAILLKLNAEKPMHHLGTVTFGGLCDRYIAEELPERYSTRKSYLSNINLHIKPRWGDYLIGAVRPMAVEGWFKEMDKLPKRSRISEALCMSSSSVPPGGNCSMNVATQSRWCVSKIRRSGASGQ